MTIWRTEMATRSPTGGRRRKARAAPVEQLERRVLLAGQLFITTAASSGASNGAIGEYTTGGATVNAGLVSGLGYTYPYGVAVSGSDLFVSDYYTQTIAEYTTSGATVNASLLTSADGLTGPFGIAIAGSQLFVTNGNGGSTALDGSVGVYTLGSTPGTIASSQPNLITGVADVGSIAVSGSDLFVTDYALGTVGEYTTAGATVNAQLVTGLDNPEGVAVVGSDLFVTEQGSVATIGEYTTSGQVVNAALIPAVAGALSIGASGNDLFVTTNGGQVAEYTTAGGTVNTNLIPGLSGAFGMAVVPATSTSSIEPVASTPISAGEAFSLDNTAATYSDLGWDLTNQDHSSVTPGGFATNLGAVNFAAPTASTPYFTTTGGVNVSSTTTRQPYLYTTFDDAVQVTAGTPELFTMWVGTNGSTTLDVSLSDGSAAYPATTFTSPTEFQFVVDSATTQDVLLSATPAAGVQSGLWAVAASATTTTAPATNFAGSYTGTVTQTPAGVDSLYTYKLDLQQSGQSVTGTDDVVSSSQPQYYIDYDLSGTVTGDVLNYDDVSVASDNLPVGGVAILKAATLTLSTDGLTLQGSWSGDGYTGVINAADTAKEPKSIGGLDPTFGIGGLASHDVGFNATTGIAADGAQSVLVGPVGTSPGESFGVTRYNADGSLDTTFGNNGVTTTAYADGDAVPAAVAVLPGGDILVAGTATTYAASGASTGSEFALAEYTAAGALNPSFGTSGTLVVSFSTTPGTLSDDVLRALVVGPGGVIYLAGSSDAAGKGNTDLAIAAVTAAGAPDTAFGTDGRSLVDVAGGDDVINSLALQTNGDVVAAGSATVGGTVEVALARFLPSGALDPHFGTKGIATDKVGGVYDAAESVVVQPKGQIVIGGLTATGSGASLSSDFLVQRYTSVGHLDRSFGAGGTAVTPFTGPAAVTQVVLQADGSVVASGRTAATFGQPLEVAVARYTTAGKLDTSFAGVGKVVVDLNSGVVASAAIEVRPAAAVDLGALFDAFTASEQGVVAVTQGGAILTAGNSGADTVEAQLVAAGVDLLAKLLSSLPASVLAGLKGTATVSITESGTTKAVGTVTVTLSFATDAAGDGAVTVKTLAERVNLKQGQGHTYKVPFAYPGTVSGGYYLVASVTDGAGLSDLNLANNTAASPASVHIAPAFVALAGSGLSAASPVTPGKVARVTLDVTNDGNVTAHGRTTVELFLSPDQTVADGTQVGDPSLTVSLPPGKSRVSHLSFALPDGLAAGTFTLLAVLDPANSLGSGDQSSAQVIVGGTVTVT